MSSEILNKNYFELLDSFNFAKDNEYNNYVFRLKTMVEYKHIEIIANKKRQKEEIEENLIWNETLRLNTRKAYEDYLEKYYSGRYTTEAITRIDDFIAIEKKIKMKKKLLKLIQWAEKNEIDTDIIPRDINKLYKLEKIGITYKSRIKILPDEFTYLPNLKILVLGACGLTSLPESIGNMKSLRKLYLWQNHLNQLPISFKNLTNLEVLDLDNNSFSEVPLQIRELKKMRVLSIGCGIICRGDNSIKNIPNWIFDLKNIESLNFSGNGLKSIESDICNLTKLNYLGLYINELEKLPSCIGYLSRLEYLIVNANDLKTIPESFQNLTKLKECSLGGNFSLFIDENILKKLPKAIVKAYKDIPFRKVASVFKKIF